MATKPYRGGSAPQSRDEACLMLYTVVLIARDAYEAGAVSVSSSLTVAGFHNAQAYELAFAHDPLIEVVIRPDVFAYMKLKHPHLDTTVDVMDP